MEKVVRLLLLQTAIQLILLCAELINYWQANTAQNLMK